MHSVFSFQFWVLSACVLSIGFRSAAQVNGRTAVLNYVRHLAKPDGGYGWADQPDAHLTPTYAAIGTLYDLDQLPANRSGLIQFVKTHHPQHGANKEAGPSGTEERDLVYQQIQSLIWLGGNADSFKVEVLNWKPQNNKVSNFEEHGYPVFLQEMMTPVCRGLLHLSQEPASAHFAQYLQSRRRSNGSFNNNPAAEGGDGNVINTYWGLYGKQQLDEDDSQKRKAITWLQSCQLKNGGFTHQPKPEIAGNDDVAYTWAAVKGLQLLSAEPANKTACIRYLLSLRNNDGGFGKGPGQPSTPMSTFYAIDALKSLQALAALDKAQVATIQKKSATNFSGLKIFTVQFEASGSGSPKEAVMLADSLHIHLWGTKNASPAWRITAQQIADDQKVPVRFFQSDEAYGKAVSVKGFGTFSHVMDYIAPAGLDQNLQLDGSSWQQYRKTFVDPLLQANGALILQVTNNEPLGRMLLDESVRKGGFAAISTIHFGQNFSFWLPWLHQYRYQLPFVALQDAHGTESWWWLNELSGYRTLFLGKSGSYDDLMQALKNNLVVAVRHDSVSDYKTRMLGGAEGVQAFVRARQDRWQWWTKNDSSLNIPWAAVTVIAPKDSFEVARPQKGLNIRIRCWWNSIRQNLQEPFVALDQLKVNGKEVKPEMVEVKDKRGNIADSYYLYAIPDAGPENITIETRLKNLRTGQVQTQTKVVSPKRI